MLPEGNDSHSVQITCWAQALVTQLSSTLPEHYISGKSGPFHTEMFTAKRFLEMTMLKIFCLSGLQFQLLETDFLGGFVRFYYEVDLMFQVNMK